MPRDLVEKALMGPVHIRSHEKGLIRERRLETLRVGESGSIHKYKRVELAVSDLLVPFLYTFSVI